MWLSFVELIEIGPIVLVWVGRVLGPLKCVTSPNLLDNLPVTIPPALVTARSLSSRSLSSSEASLTYAIVCCLVELAVV